MRSLLEVISRTAAFVCAMITSAVALGQAVQVLDSVDAFGKNSPTSATVREMAFRDSNRTEPFQPLNVGATALVACQRAADQALYCIDGATVRLWPDTKQVPYGTLIPDRKLFSCTDRDLGFDTRRANPCTSLTVDLDGTLWVAGRKANSHSLVKIIEKSRLLTGSCSTSGSIATGWVELDRIDAAAPLYCAREWAPGRPVLVDISSIDGEIVDGFTKDWSSILGVEERKTVVLFPDAPSLVPIEVASGKAGWNLIGNEQLLSASLLQFGEPTNKKNYVLVTTTLGRVLAKAVDSATGTGFDPAFPVYKFDTRRCSGSGEQNYGIRVSSQSGRVYVSDRFCREVAALKVAPSTATCDAGAKFCLEAATEGTAQTPVVLSTGADTSPDGISVAPGIGIDLRDCGFDPLTGKALTCPIVGDGNGNQFNAAQLTGVRLVDSNNNGMTVFQVKGIPDCRWWPTHPVCEELQMNVGPDDYLDVSNLLPDEVISQVEKILGTILPSLWISPKYRGQDSGGSRMQPTEPGDSDYAPTIDLFFGITEPNVQFRDTFAASFDIADLVGQEWGCDKGVQVVEDSNGVPAPPDLQWDVVITISEKYATVGGRFGDITGPAKEHTDMLVNTGCINPTQVSGGRWSLYAYNLEVAPEGDSVYAILMRSLYKDLYDAQFLTACDNVDGQAIAPISSCAELETKWQAAFEKLDRCIIGSTYPRQSEAVNNCQSFLSQLSQYDSALNSVPIITANDPANRIGELKVRSKVVRYVFENHFIPSIPPDGFRCETTSTGSCPAP